MIIKTSEQGSLDWLKDRQGILTSTKLKKCVGKKLNLVGGFRTEMYKLIFERATGRTTEKIFSNDATERGNNLEPYARQELIDITGLNFNQFGLCVADENEFHGCSPDGFTGNFRFGCEIKCPENVNHLRAINPDDSYSIFNEYRIQCLNYFLVNEKLETLFTVSYCPEFEIKPIWIEEIHRSDIEDELTQLQTAVNNFFAEYHKTFEILTSDF